MSAAVQIKQVYPYLRCHDAARAIEFYREVFGAQEIFRMTEKPTGRVGHAELRLGELVLMISDEYPEVGIRGPLAYGGTGSSLHLHVSDVDTLYARALVAGATSVSLPTDQFYGERSCKLRDPWGHEWMLGQEIEKLSHAEMQKRYDAMFE